MALFMTLLVRDEEDILEANLRYHLEHGVDHVIVTDNLSTDSSRDIVQNFVAQGVATYIFEPEDTYSQSKWVSRMAAMAHEAGAKWVVHSDADEFWMTRRRQSLRKWFSRQLWPNIVSAPRHDFLCLEDDGSPFWQRMIYRKTHSTNPLGKRLPPKVAHRTAKDLVVAQGNHSVSGLRWPRQRSSGLEILHFPLRSRAQYLRKIESGGRAYGNNYELSKSVGNTWRQQYEELRETGKLAYVENNIVKSDQLNQMRSDGMALEDRRLLDFMKAKA